MNPELEKKIKEALADSSNVGELPEADAVGTVGNSECGEMLRMWIKYKEDKGKKIIDKATFQSFGCETAIAVASLATQVIQGKTQEEAMNLKPEDLSKDLGPLPPMKIHCAQLVEGALKSALTSKDESPAQSPEPEMNEPPTTGTLIDSLQNNNKSQKKLKFLPRD